MPAQSTPSPKPEGGYTAHPTPPLTKDRVPSPSRCTHPATVSDGVTTELSIPHAQQKGGTPPLKSTRGGTLPPCPKYEGGYTHPLSKKRGGDTGPSYPHSKVRERVPLPPSHTKDPPHLPHGPGRWFAWSHDGEGIARPGIPKGGYPLSLPGQGTTPSPSPKNERGYPTPQSEI